MERSRQQAISNVPSKYSLYRDRTMIEASEGYVRPSLTRAGECSASRHPTSKGLLLRGTRRSLAFLEGRPQEPSAAKRGIHAREALGCCCGFCRVAHTVASNSDCSHSSRL